MERVKFSMFVFVAVLISLLYSAYSSDRAENLSFMPPYNDVDFTGTRIINNHWNAGGTTQVNNNFIRLTTDRQSKKGAIWNNNPIGVTEFTAYLKFRISGQGKNLFGDGIAFWLTTNSYWVDGTLHGSDEKFTGVGIILDTFKNSETLSAHKDILVLVNDGTKTYDNLVVDTTKLVGCDSSFRYHNARGDFSVKDHATLKVMVKGNALRVEVDTKGTGSFEECVELTNIGLTDDWSTRSYFGVTASTGQLADNHDILSFETYTDVASRPLQDVPKIAYTETASVENNLRALNEHMNKLIKRIETLEHHTEHHALGVEDDIKHILLKLGQRESLLEEKLEKIKEKIHMSIEDRVEDEFQNLEENLKYDVEHKIGNMRDELSIAHDDIKRKATNVKGTTTAWQIPFFILALIVIAAGVWMFMFYQKISKMHLL